MTMRRFVTRRDASTSVLPQALKTWRVTTAARVFMLAMITGLTLSNGRMAIVGVTLTTLVVLAAIMSIVELGDSKYMPLLPVAEATLAAGILISTNIVTGPLLAYLAIPPLVAGLRHGVVSCLNAVGAEILVVLGIVIASRELDSSTERLHTAATWLAVGLGAGLLAAWMRGSARSMEAAQAPYVAAHRLLTQLRSVSRRLTAGLDASTIAREIAQTTDAALEARRTSVLIGASSTTLLPLYATGQPRHPPNIADDRLVEECISTATAQCATQSGDFAVVFYRVALPLRSAGRVVGAVVADSMFRLKPDEIRSVQASVDELALQLDTALLFDEVGMLATTEERNRLAREIHDGIAQEIASLGYLVDDLAAGATSVATRDAAAHLREEISRVVAELRLSIFGMRHNVDGHAGLGRALTEYVGEVGARSNLRVHLELKERYARLRPEVESELLRIAQEAITNTRKHADAHNLWVRLRSEDDRVSLQVEDDGTGVPKPRRGHYGLHSMHERAERIGAELTIQQRAGGGTAVAVYLPADRTATKGLDSVDYGATG
jgi:signal transduction histidine kinase